MKPFVKIFQGQVPDQHAKTYVCGLLSNLERKNVESIAYRFGHSRLPLQAFIGWDEWDDEPLRLELRHQVKTHLGQGDGVLGLIPRDFPSPAASRSVWPDSGVAVWAKSTTAKWPFIWATSPERATPWLTSGFFCPKTGPKTKPAWTKPVFPTPLEPITHVISWPWRCWSKIVLGCHMAGLPVTTRWGARLGFGVDWPPWGNATCWRYPRTRRCVIWRSSRPSTAAGGDGLGVRGTRSRPGVMDVMMRPGSALRCAMVAKAHWWLRRLRGGWYREPIGVNRATRCGQ